MSRPSCKARLLEAAESVVLEEGASRLTLDAVAERAGVSKGGVLYHFPTKDALLTEMLARHLERAHSRREEACACGTHSPLAVEILAALHRDPKDLKISAALLAAVANDPALMGPARDFHIDRFNRIAGENVDRDMVQRMILLLAVDGLFFLELLQLSPFNAEQRAVLVDALVRMADGGDLENHPVAGRDTE